MKLFSDPQASRSHGYQLAQLVLLGGREMERAYGERGRVDYANWAVAVRSSAMLHDLRVPPDQLAWLWNSLRTEPTVRESLGDLPPAGMRWEDRDERFPVLKAGECFVVGLKRGHMEELRRRPRGNPFDEQVVVELKGPLAMKPGKANRLECCDASAEVTIRVDSVFSREREADIMRVDEEKVALDEGCVHVTVESLNQAYTVASRRLEPERRSHGGRAYDRFLYVGRAGRILLEDIRQTVEAETWEVPEPTDRPAVSSGDMPP